MADLIHHVLSKSFPSVEMAAFEIATLKAQLEIPKGVIHVISDIHGEARKLRHVINNASGSLRPLVEKIFKHEMREEEMKEFLNLLYYPTEMLQSKYEGFENTEQRYAWVLLILQRQFTVIREIVRTKRRKHVKHYTPKEFRELFEVLLNFPAGGHHEAFLEVQLKYIVEAKLDQQAIRAAARFIRNVTVEELVVAGDLGDRGDRIDGVIEYLMKQPAVSMVWGNHDVLWMGACLGHESLIATVLRISLRYRRLFQLEEGYGILTKALETLVEKVYSDDPAEQFMPKRGGERDSLLIARMQKAIAIIEFKLEGQVVDRNSEWQMEQRNLMKNIDFQKGTVLVDGQQYKLLDKNFPTVDPADPHKLSPEEKDCMDRLVQSFMSSATLWKHMNWVTERGSMCMVRDKAVVFHACLTLNEEDDYQSLIIDGKECKGTEQFDAFNAVIKRAYRNGRDASQEDKDWFFYLWAGPKSPLFGKSKMATFERYLLAEKETHKEPANKWFSKLDDFDFCNKVCQDLGVESGGLIVNGHVPVNIEKGESPIKKGGNAVVIDGAFSEAYGDKGYTLILSADGERIAQHHGFKDPVSVVRSGEDIIPEMHDIRTYDQPRMVKETAEGKMINIQIEALEGLIEAYLSGEISESGQV